MIRDKGDLLPLIIFAMGLKNNAEENLKALKDAVKLSMVGWMILDIPRFSSRMSTSHKAMAIQGWCLVNLLELWPQEVWAHSSLKQKPLDF
jgi:hypothetical protein